MRLASGEGIPLIRTPSPSLDPLFWTHCPNFPRVVYALCPPCGARGVVIGSPVGCCDWPPCGARVVVIGRTVVYGVL
eukprot:518359-Pyramimonas_sp.AAC.1